MTRADGATLAREHIEACLRVMDRSTLTARGHRMVVKGLKAAMLALPPDFPDPRAVYTLLDCIENMNAADHDVVREYQRKAGEMRDQMMPVLSQHPDPVAEKRDRCPQCRGTVMLVTQGEYAWMNRDQFDAVKAGDYYCESCPPNDRAENGKHCYWWERELVAAEREAERGRDGSA